MSGDRMTSSFFAWEAIPASAGTLNEGARWLGDIQKFQWVDIIRGTINRCAVGSDVVETRGLGLEFVTVALPLDGDRSVVASRNSLHEYSWDRDELSTLGTWQFDEDVRFNDGGISPDGEVFVGTMSMAGRPDAGHLFRYADGDLTPVVTGVGISNGIAWTAPDHALYIDSTRAMIGRLDLTSPWPCTPETVVELPQEGEPDGLTIDARGHVWVAMWEGSRLIRTSVDGGAIEYIDMPVTFPTSIALSDEWVVVTSALVDPSQRRTALDGFVLRARLTD